MSEKPRKNHGRPQEPEREKSQGPPLKVLVNRRMALAAIIAGVGFGTWTISRDEKPPIETIPEKPKTFPKTLEVQGMKIRLDESWNNYPLPEGKTLEGLFQVEFQNIHAFYQTYGINLTGREFAFVYNPDLNDYGSTPTVIKNYSSGSVEHEEFDKEGTMKSVHIFIKDVTQKPTPVQLKFFRGSTIAHEVFHVLHGAYLQTSILWQEGIAEALESFYEKRFPGSEIIQNSNRGLVEKFGKIDALTEEFYAQQEIRKYLINRGFDENWILQGQNQFSERSSTLPRDVAGLRWESFLAEHPDFLSKFLAQLDEITRLSQEKTTGDKDFVVIGNDRELKAVGHLAAPEYFWEWMKQEKIFERGRAGEKLVIAYSHHKAPQLTVISAQWADETLTSSPYPDFTTTIPRLSPRPFTMTLKSGKEFTIISQTVFSSLPDIGADQIQSLKDFEGNDIQIVR